LGRFIENSSGVRTADFAKSKKSVKSTMFPDCNIHKYIWTSDGKTHNQIDHVMIYKILLLSDTLKELRYWSLIGG